MNRRGPRRNWRVRKLTKTAGGRSFCVTLPIRVVRKFGWRERQKLELRINERNKTILIRDWEKRSRR
jgi:bifunctional DNA-binding transcriptional regulator/antitoxin component of YhaV-PrlF toxin-antitoxin module